MLAKKFYVIQPVTRADSDLSSYDMIEWPEEQKCVRLTVWCGETDDVTVDAVVCQRISSGTIESPMVEIEVAKNLLQNKTRWVIADYLKSWRVGDNEK